MKRGVTVAIAAGIAAAALSSSGAGASEADNPWFGTWKLRLNDPKEAPETLVYSDAGGGAMRMVSVESGSRLTTRFDGRPALDESAPPDKPRTLAVQWRSPTSYLWTFAIEGKPIVQGHNTLSADRSSFTEIAWTVERPDKIFTLIYERQ